MGIGSSGSGDDMKDGDPIMVKCPRCGKQFTYAEVKRLGHSVPTHDSPKFCRSLCPGSGMTPRVVLEPVDGTSTATDQPDEVLASDVAKMLRVLKSEVENAGDGEKMVRFARAVGDVAWNNLEVIARALDVLEGVSLLVRHDPMISIGQGPHGTRSVVFRSTTNQKKIFTGVDVHAAVTAAVEFVRSEER